MAFHITLKGDETIGFSHTFLPNELDKLRNGDWTMQLIDFDVPEMITIGKSQLRAKKGVTVKRMLLPAGRYDILALKTILKEKKFPLGFRKQEGSYIMSLLNGFSQLFITGDLANVLSLPSEIELTSEVINELFSPNFRLYKGFLCANIIETETFIGTSQRLLAVLGKDHIHQKKPIVSLHQTLHLWITNLTLEDQKFQSEASYIYLRFEKK